MAKEQPITIDGIIKETLPSAMFRVEVEIGGNLMKFWLMLVVKCACIS